MNKELPLLDTKIKESILAELKRQAEERPDRLKVTGSIEQLKVEGQVDLDPLALVVVGAVAGGP